MSAYVSSHYIIVLVKVQIVFFLFFFSDRRIICWKQSTSTYSEVMKGIEFYTQSAEQMFWVLKGAVWIILHNWRDNKCVESLSFRCIKSKHSCFLQISNITSLSFKGSMLSRCHGNHVSLSVLPHCPSGERCAPLIPSCTAGNKTNLSKAVR